MFISFFYPHPKESQVGFEIMSLNLSMEGKEDLAEARFKGRQRHRGARNEPERES